MLLFCLFEIISFKASVAKSTVISRFVKDEYATILINAPSSSLMLDFILVAMYTITSLGTFSFSTSAFFFKIAILVSKSGAWISAIRPHSNLERNLSSKVGISLGGLSDDRIICLFASCNVLKVWKNSSWVLSLPAINWISSINKTSTLLYLVLNSSFLSSFIAFISSLVNFSDET